ncbi:recombinase family protein [Sphaerisporangium fuscum]|uniref:recombinase family protein n=1 Tax=Sphaerisporangium fuscum TaxID=2835868 RepID=UPI001BDCA722|nr:recombinase family protein [Sphaerisporangium fuscum]
MERLGYGDIADRLNAHHERYPPPESLNPNFRGRNCWSRSGVREMLRNPKYTGYMVWNRKATTSRRGGKRSMDNPPSAWVRSPQPTHEPLVTREMYDQAQEIGAMRRKSRTSAVPNKHPRTARTYLLRSFISCGLCRRRMYGQTDDRRPDTPITRYVCQPDRIRHRDDRFRGHPPAVRVREDAILEAVYDLFQRRVFGARRHELLAADLPKVNQEVSDDWDSRRRALTRTPGEIVRKQDRLIGISASSSRSSGWTSGTTPRSASPRSRSHSTARP